MSAMIIVTEKLIEGGMSPQDVDHLISRFIDEEIASEHPGQSKFPNKISKYSGKNVN